MGLISMPKKSTSLVPLHAAVRKENLETVECLLALGADIHKRGVDRSTILHTASSNKSLQVADYLINKGASVNGRDTNGVTPLHMAVLENNLSLVEFLLNHEADVNATGNLFFKDCTPLHLAVTYCAKDMVQLLVSRGAKIDGPGPKTPLRMAIDGNHLSIVKCLVENGVDERSTAIHLAVDLDSVEALKLLLKAGVCINTKDPEGRTPCHLAAEVGNLGLLQIILDFGGDVGARDVAGRTPLHYAAQRCHLQVVLMLLKYGASVNCLDNDKQTPVLSAFNSRARGIGDQGIEDLDLILLMAQQPKDQLLKVLHVLIKQVVMLKMAQLYVCKENLNATPRKFEEAFGDECKEEVDKLKRERIYKRITFWDFLRSSENFSAKIADKIDLGVVSCEYKMKFPIYYTMILNQVLRAVERNKLLKRCEDLCEFLVDNFGILPYHCVERIVRHLGTDDLRMHVNIAELKIGDSWDERKEEFEDRRRRRENIVLFGVPEGNDEEVVGRILQGLKQVVDVKSERFGEGEPRALRIVVGEEKVDALLLEHSRLRRLMMLPTVLQGIVVTRDLTVMQREQGKKKEVRRKSRKSR